MQSTTLTQDEQVPEGYPPAEPIPADYPPLPDLAAIETRCAAKLCCRIRRASSHAALDRLEDATWQSLRWSRPNRVRLMTAIALRRRTLGTMPLARGEREAA